MRYCAQPGCGVKVERGRCAAHARAQQRTADAARTNPAQRKLYMRKAWREHTRPAVLAEQGLCVQCQREGRVTPATVVDHDVPARDRPLEQFHDRANLQALCAACHSRKTRRGR